MGERKKRERINWNTLKKLGHYLAAERWYQMCIRDRPSTPETPDAPVTPDTPDSGNHQGGGNGSSGGSGSSGSSSGGPGNSATYVSNGPGHEVKEIAPGETPLAVMPANEMCIRDRVCIIPTRDFDKIEITGKE